MNKPSFPIQLFAHICLVLFCCSCLLPMVLTVSISLTDGDFLQKFGYSIWPGKLSFEAYAYIFQDMKTLVNGYKNSILLVVFGTTINLLITSMVSYTLARRDFRFRGAVSVYIFITMIFSGGLVPTYIVIVQYLGWKDMLLALIIPPMAAPFQIFLLRVFFQEVPQALIESVKIDGASDWRAFWSIVLPLSKPALATLALMMTLHYWNETFNAMLYIDSPNTFPIQLVLKNIQGFVEMVRNIGYDPGGNIVDPSDVPTESIMYAMMVLTSLPMLFMFSFLQKYFVKGLTIGAVKG